MTNAEIKTHRLGQPFLVLHLEGQSAIYVDVGGHVELFLDTNEIEKMKKQATNESGLSAEELKKHATPLMKMFARQLKSKGLAVTRVGFYRGTGSGTHLWRGGELLPMPQDPSLLRKSDWMDEE